MFTEQAKLVASDGTEYDSFGRGVSISGHTAVVGAFLDNPVGIDAGSAYVFVRNGTTWTQQAKLVASDANSSELFGESVSISGDTVLVGARLDDHAGGDNAGSAYVFVRNGTTWAQQAKLVASDAAAEDQFGTGVSIHGGTVIVGAPFHNHAGGIDAGAAYVFVRNGTTWTQQAKLVASDAAFADLLGIGVSIHGDTALVGAIRSNRGVVDETGAAYVFVRNGTTWAQQAKLEASDGAFRDHLGASLSIWGDTALVAAFEDDHAAGPNAGSAYVFVRNGSIWTQQAKLVASDAAANDWFGWSVSISDDTALIGAENDSHAGGSAAGSAYVFVRNGSTWTEQTKLVASDATGGDLFGSGVSVSSGVVLVGAEGGSNEHGTVTGSAYVFAAVPCFTLDFETEDDLVTPLSNGQHIDTEFGSLVTIHSSGANAGLGIFDSTAGGPNDPSQDRDLLVDTGNILILQTENFPPDGNDIFPRPNDDDDGGTISFAFTCPVKATSLRLIDIDAGDGAATLILTDASARQRVYTVPSNWTGDLLLSQPGQGILDLTSLAPQPGFGSVATATQDAAFDAANVVRLDVRLNGSGGLDDLDVCFTNLPRAAVVARNGAETNSVNLSSTSLPVLGTPWGAVLDCSDYGRGQASLVVRRRATSGLISPFGELLVGGAFFFQANRAFSASSSSFTWPIPHDTSLLGLDVHAQGLCLEAPGSASAKLRAAHGGLSNALDLILGF